MLSGLIAEHERFISQRENYLSRKAWMQYKSAVEMSLAAANSKFQKDYTEIAALARENNAIKALESGLAMTANEFREFPFHTKNLLDRLDAAFQTAERADWDTLAELAISIQQRRLGLGLTFPATAHSCKQHFDFMCSIYSFALNVWWLLLSIIAADLLEELVLTPVATPVSTPAASPKPPKHFIKECLILDVKPAFVTGSAAHSNPTIRKILRGHFVQKDAIKNQQTKHDFVIKCAALENETVPNAQQMQAIKREGSYYESLQSGLDFPATTGCVWCFDVHPQHHYLVLEDYGQDLRQALCIENRTQLLVMEEATIALKALHARTIVHGDIKPQNVLYKFEQNGSCKVKLCDLDCAHEVGAECVAASLGTTGYYPPETFFAVLRGTTHITAAFAMDIFALGLVF